MGSDEIGNGLGLTTISSRSQCTGSQGFLLLTVHQNQLENFWNRILGSLIVPVPVGSNECSDISILKSTELESNRQPRLSLLLDTRVSIYLWMVAVHGSVCTSGSDKHMCVHRELRWVSSLIDLHPLFQNRVFQYILSSVFWPGRQASKLQKSPASISLVLWLQA